MDFRILLFFCFGVPRFIVLRSVVLRDDCFSIIESDILQISVLILIFIRKHRVLPCVFLCNFVYCIDFTLL